MKKLLSGIITLFVLSPTIYAQQDIVNAEMMRNDFSNFARAEDSRFITAGSIPSFTPKEETVGSRYLFDKWVHGVVVSVVDSVYSDPNTLFNYNKAAGTLIMTKDKKTAIELYLNKIKSFTLSDDKTYHFERVGIINDNDFFLTLVKNNSKYSLYKLVKTKFIAANYSTNGIIETGNKYDEYKDIATYYVVLPGGKEFKKIELKKKSIKTVLTAGGSKVDKYMSDNSGEVDEAFLIGLVTDLNQ
ncbi:MAG: hypothetical protein ACHQF0_16025 [Chitinophagales bacterium]